MINFITDKILKMIKNIFARPMKISDFMERKKLEMV